MRERHAARQRIGQQRQCHAAIEQGEIAYDAHDRLLLAGFDPGRPHQLRRMPEPCPFAGGGDNAAGLAATHQGPGIGRTSRAGFDGLGFSGQHGLIEQNRSLRHTDVRGDDAAQRYLDDIIDNQGRGRRDHPRPVPENRRRKGEPRLERVERPLGPAFLEKSESGVEQEQKADDRRLDIVL